VSGYGFEWEKFGPNRFDLIHPRVSVHSPAKVVRSMDGRITAWVDGEQVGDGFATFDDAMQAAWEFLTGDAE
jgi:hypothetical protein